MKRKDFIDNRFVQVLIHFFSWVSVFFFWYKYYQVVDPPEVIAVNALICTVFASASFYLAFYWLAAKMLVVDGMIMFLGFSITTLLILSPLRSFCIYLSFQYTLPGNNGWEIFRSLSTSIFHIAYSITIATVARLMIRQYDIKQKLNELEKEKIWAELQYLKDQINPHFLFNIHNSIYFLITEDPKLASKVVLKLSEIMRYQLYECRQNWVTLSHELANIENYMELEKIRSADQIKIDYHKDIISGARMIAPFILITFIENGFKHISRESNSENRIAVVAKQEAEWLVFNVGNTVSLIQKKTKKNFSGLGLENLKKRLNLIYPGQYKLTVDSTENFFDIRLKLPLR